MTIAGLPAPPPLGRRIWANRTLNLRSIKAIGYDMDYTLVHYRVEPWEQQAYQHLKAKLAEQGLPVEGLEFDPDLVTRGLVVDRELGNLVKANRFGYVVKACHGTVPLPFETLRATYGRLLVDLSDERFSFLNTLFSLSEACLFAQLVDRLDERSSGVPLGYADLHRLVRRGMDEAHLEGALKAIITTDPASYVEPDPETALALLDQLHAGRRLLLITNSDWPYTRTMMAHAFDPFLPQGMHWQDLFEVVLVSARKPDFFLHPMPLFQVVSDDGLLTPCPGGLRRPGVYVGGDAREVQRYLGLAGEEILYVGDHLFTDVHVSKNVMRWRTALVLRELEAELEELERFGPEQTELARLMEEKARLEFELSQLRLAIQRLEQRYGPRVEASLEELRSAFAVQRERLSVLDATVAPLARRAGELANRRWGLLMRAGNDKSMLARQVERYADIYTSRVSNFLFETPFAYLRAPRGSLPHDDTRLVE
ncbi:MAG: HAD-IG family 5'-nucleotidase [Thermoanaerobaculaceae bacterium]|nr:HAD-IG family 5'-nucleotidase [Thermoanaerobaculaceae bacterium]